MNHIGVTWTSSLPNGGPSENLGPNHRLPKLLGGTKIAPPERVSQSMSSNYWSARHTDSFAKSSPSPRINQQAPVATSTQVGQISSQSVQPAGAMFLQKIEKELDLQGLLHVPPSIDRVRVFSSAFSEVIDNLPSYRGLLLSVQKEYDALIARLHSEANACAPLEARLRTMKAASLSCVGESMSWFQAENNDMKRRLEATEADNKRLTEENQQLREKNDELDTAHSLAKSQAKDSHQQNIDILRHMDRVNKQVESLRKQEKETQGTMNTLQQKLKEKESRISIVERQLEEARAKIANMVPREDMDAVLDEKRLAEQKIEELEAIYQSKQRDYVSIVEAYTKVSGQGMDEFGATIARPLTPRPKWFHCKGLLDPDDQHTVEKAERSQEILQNMLVCTRTLLCAYGLQMASDKLKVSQNYCKHPATLPLAIPLTEGDLHGKSVEVPAVIEEEADANQSGEGLAVREGDEWLPADTEDDTPHQFRHPERMKNLRFSRRKVADIIEGLLQKRQKPGTDLSLSFTDVLMDNLPDGLEGDDATLFGINIYSAVRRYCAEPDFLCYYLLLNGTISDCVVRDNKSMCAELLKIFKNHFEPADGLSHITKQKFFYGVREVLPNKEKDMWQELVGYFPAGGADLLVNYEWLLFDDLYVLSPVVYALRLQHLEEAIGLTGRMDKLVRGCATEGVASIAYEQIEGAFRDHAELGLMGAEELARAFDVHVSDLKDDTERDLEEVLAVLKHADIFHILFFPALASDDGDLELTGGGDKETL